MKNLIPVLILFLFCNIASSQDCSVFNDIKKKIATAEKALREAITDKETKKAEKSVDKLTKKLEEAKKKQCGALNYSDYESNRIDGTLCKECCDYHMIRRGRNRKSFNAVFNERNPDEGNCGDGGCKKEFERLETKFYAIEKPNYSRYIRIELDLIDLQETCKGVSGLLGQVRDTRLSYLSIQYQTTLGKQNTNTNVKETLSRDRRESSQFHKWPG